jgi:hypothetical protein
MTVLASALHDALVSRFPSVRVSRQSRFLPMLDLSKGELSSTAAIEVARALRGDAPSIAQQLVEDITRKVPGDWNVVAGYIVLSDTPREILREEVRSREEIFAAPSAEWEGRPVVCLVPDATTPIYARLRLIACAALQALLAVSFEGRCRLGFEPDDMRLVSSRSDIVDLVIRAVERCFQSEAESRVGYELPSQLLSPAVPVTVWTSHHYHDRLSKHAKQAFVEARNAGGGTLKIPPDGWLLSRDRALSELLSSRSLEAVVRRLSTKEAWLRWIHHFACSVPSGDLDPSVALYDETASPRWTLQVLHQRVQELVSPQVRASGRDLIAQVVAAPIADRGLLLRALFLPLLTERAIREGEVLAWSSVVEEFAARAHALLNSPSFRVALNRDGASEQLMQINAGLVFGIVGILSAVSED